MSSDPILHDEAYPEASLALDALHATLLALARERVRPFRAPVTRAVPHALRLARSYRQDRARFVEALKRAVFEPEAYDDVEQRALALWAADARLHARREAQRALPPLLAEATPLRRELMRAGEYLWGNDPELAVRIDALRSGRGHADLAEDLNRLVALFEGEWAYAEANSAVTRAQLNRAHQLGIEIARLLDGEESDAETATRRELRDRAAAYLEEAVTEIRRAAAYVFFHEPDRLDAYPSLYDHLARPKRRNTKAAEPEATVETPAAEPELV